MTFNRSSEKKEDKKKETVLQESLCLTTSPIALETKKAIHNFAHRIDVGTKSNFSMSQLLPPQNQLRCVMM